MKVAFEELKQALARVKDTVAKGKTVEAFTRICIRDGKLSSFDGMSGTITSCGLNGFEFCVSSKKFVALAHILSKKEGTLEHKDGWLYITCEDYSTQIPTFDVIEFPDLMPKGKTDVFCTATNLVQALKACSVTMEADESKTKIYGAAFRGNYVYSTDGKRVTRARLNAPVTGAEGQVVSIAKPAVEQLIRLGQPKYLFLAESNVGAFYPDIKTVLIARCMVGSFPFDLVDKCLSIGSNDWSYPVPPTLLEVVERVKALVDDEESQLLLTCDGSRLIIATKASETGRTEEVISFDIQTDFKIKIKAESLRTTLRALKPTQIDLTDIAMGDSRMLLFRGEGFESAVALMV